MFANQAYFSAILASVFLISGQNYAVNAFAPSQLIHAPYASAFTAAFVGKRDAISSDDACVSKIELRMAGGDDTSTSAADEAAVTGATINTSFMWNAGLSFGKGDFKFYRSFNDFMSPFPEEDRLAYPEIFNLPKGVYEVNLLKPLGIVFEEIEAGKGLYVKDLVEGGNAEMSGMIKPNDILIGMTAVKIVGAKYERRLIPASKFDFDTMVGAIESNDPKWACTDVVMMFQRPDEADAAKIKDFMQFFEPPWTSPWRQSQ